MRQSLSYEAAPLHVREDLEAAHQRAWQHIAAPGTWLDGARRLAIAAEARQAPHCTLCTSRQEALSPSAVDGTHDSLGDLPQAVVEVIHRIITDPGRLTERWYRQTLDRGVSDTEYVETLGVVAHLVAIDTFARGIDIEAPPLPEPVDGEPSRVRPQGAKAGAAWVPWIAPEDVTAAEADLYGGRPAHIRWAMSLVPDEVRGFFDLVQHQYLAGEHMRDFSREFRAITHAQIELVAARVSALNQCVY